MSDVENSDDERYANESFETESDNEIPEITEFESETTENSDDDDDVLPSVKENTGLIKRDTHRFSATRNTDTIPFASSSEEEDDVIVGQTFAEINTPSMHFEATLTTSSILNSETILQENDYRLNSVEEQHESSNEFLDENEEEEFEKIKEIEERYMQQKSAKTPKSLDNNENENSLPGDEERYLTTDDESEEQEAETEDEPISEDEPLSEDEPVSEDEHVSDNEPASENDYENNDNDKNKQQNHNLQSVESKESFMGNNSQPVNNLDSPDKNSNENLTLDHASLMQMIQNSLVNLKTSSNTCENDIVMTSEMLQANASLSAKINLQDIAMALVNVIKSSSLANVQTLPNGVNGNQEYNEEKNIHDTAVSDEELYDRQDNDPTNQKKVLENDNSNEDRHEIEKGDKDIEEFQNNSQICEVDYDEDIYYNSQFDYRITSKTPSSFNSDDYLFHANFIKPFYRTAILTDKLRAKPQPRKSMSFSNERMREIERHNQILLRKILAKKPTYTAKNRSEQPFIQKLHSQTNIRPTTSAVNRKKQQRQIDLDNQVLKRKIEAISLRRRPLIS